MFTLIVHPQTASSYSVRHTMQQHAQERCLHKRQHEDYSLIEFAGAHWHVLIVWLLMTSGILHTSCNTLHRCTCQIKVICHRWQICAAALIAQSDLMICQLRLNKPCSVASPAMHIILATVLMTNSNICLTHTDTRQKACRH